MNPLKIGLFGIGLDAYWPQFAGLKERLEGYLDAGPAEAGAPGNRGRQSRPDRHARRRPSTPGMRFARRTST